MAPAPTHTIVNVGYRSTNYWVVSAGVSRILIDIGWPGSLGTMLANLKRIGIPPREIRYALATHYHIDHAGLGEELKREGVTLLVIDIQAAAVGQMKQWTKPADKFVDITSTGNHVISCRDSRQFLARLGIAGEIIATPGHSDHCVSLLLDDGSAFTGDLPWEGVAFDNPVALASWDTLRSRGATRVYPGHGPIRPIGTRPA